MRGRERETSVSIVVVGGGSHCCQCEFLLTMLTFLQKHNHRDIFEIMWYLFCAKQKRPKNWGKKRSGKTWKMKSGSGVDCKDDRNQGEMQYLEGG